MAKEPIPTKDYLIPLDHYFLSPGKTLIYRVVSGAMCRIYWQDFDDKTLSNSAKNHMNWGITPELTLEAPTAWKTESAWYSYVNKKGETDWKRDGANFPSYVVKLLDFDDTNAITQSTIMEVTVRCVPIQSSELAPLLEIRKMAKAHYLNSPIRPSLLSEEYTEKIRRIAA